jgi:hypothetical protein
MDCIPAGTPTTRSVTQMSFGSAQLRLAPAARALFDYLVEEQRCRDDYAEALCSL